MFDPLRLWDLAIPPRRFRYGERDTMLYALGIGLGRDPMDTDELKFVYEDGLQAVPTQATVIAWDRDWVDDSGIPWDQVVHGEQRIEMHSSLPPTADILSTARVAGVLDKGTGALVQMETTISHADSGQRLCTSTTGFFVRGAGGFGARGASETIGRQRPSRKPDAIHQVSVAGNQALLYRLSGDRNPQHACPRTARERGFERPVLHGLCTYGMACAAVLKHCCNWVPTRITGFDARFSAPVFPGDTLSFAMWLEGRQVVVEGRCDARACVVLQGQLMLRDAAAM